MPEPPACASCGRRPVDPRYRPFCSERCKLVDLDRWLSGSYRIPGEPSGEPDGEDPVPDSERDF